MATMTVAICARRAENFIGQCLESIFRQTCPPDEVIVAVDDLSDPTADVARRYGANVIESRATGLYEARNAVLNVCSTDYLGFVDADCVMSECWVDLAKRVLDSDSDIAAGTGKHPPIGRLTFAGWLHHMWFIVETETTGETSGVIGGNSYFRTDALRKVGGWLPLPNHSAAEDLYISLALRNHGYRIWFEADAAVKHHYETSLRGLFRKAALMGRDIVVMLRKAGWFGRLWWYTLSIPVMALSVLLGCLILSWYPELGAVLTMLPLFATLLFLTWRFRSLRVAFPRWLARWVIIWPYSWGIVKGLLKPLPKVDAT